MYSFRNHRELLESNLVDKYVFETLISRQILPFLLSLWFWQYTDNLLLFLVPLLSIYLRGKLTDSIPRRVLTCAGIGLSWWGQAHFWTGLLVSIELARIALIYGIPFFLRRVSEEMPRDAIGETGLKRIVRLLRGLRSTSAGVAMNEYLSIYQQYQAQDATEPFSQQERDQFERFFRDFDKTALIADESIGVVLFFPGFMVRIRPFGINVDSESAMKLIERDAQPEEACPICRENSPGPWVELSCRHQYCVKCIVRWLQEQAQCPLCRNPVS